MNARDLAAFCIDALEKCTLGVFNVTAPDGMFTIGDVVKESIAAANAPMEARTQLLTTMPGISDVLARTIVAEIGLDMSRFPTSAHLVSWAGLCPHSDESAGKRRSTRIRKGDPWLKTALVSPAWGATRKKESYPQSQYLRIKTRRGAKKAIIAVAASMLTAVHLSRGRTGVRKR